MAIASRMTGKIEEGRTLRRFLERTGQPLMQDWIVEMGKKLLAHLPVKMLVKMGIAGVLAPRTRGWAKAGAAIQEYQHLALCVEMAADRFCQWLAKAICCRRPNGVDQTQ